LVVSSFSVLITFGGLGGPQAKKNQKTAEFRRIRQIRLSTGAPRLSGVSKFQTPWQPKEQFYLSAVALHGENAFPTTLKKVVSPETIAGTRCFQVSRYAPGY
jgi:hypothetical protein